MSSYLNYTMTFNARHECVDVRDSTGEQLVPALLSSLHARDFAAAIHGVITRTEYSLNAAGFRYDRPELRDPDETPWEGVKVTVLDDERIVEERQFARLMLITAQTFMVGVQLTKHPMLSGQRWIDLSSAVETLARLIAETDDAAPDHAAVNVA